MLRLLLVSTLLLRASSTVATTKAMALRAADFEVFGRVQGVFFRKSGSTSAYLHASRLASHGVNNMRHQKYTKEQATKLGLKGWCKNTDAGTVLGHMEGTADNIESMMHWLKNTGSPSSQIDKAEFRNQREIDKYTFDNFSIERD